jgi:cation transport protein ChaC
LNERPRRSDPAALWVFGYGSLMWRPGFNAERAAHARLVGWRRCFCIYSTHHRGNAQRPGLVLGLDRGGACEGIAYRVPQSRAAATLAYLRAREQINGVYREAHLPVSLEDGNGEHVLALAFVVERSHPSYAGRLPLCEQVGLIRAASGRSGSNVDYLINTLRHLEGLGVREPELQRLLTMIGPHFARREAPKPTRERVHTLIAACRNAPVTAPLMRPADRRRFNHRKLIAEWALQRAS